MKCVYPGISILFGYLFLRVHWRYQYLMKANWLVTTCNRSDRHLGCCARPNSFMSSTPRLMVVGSFIIIHLSIASRLSGLLPVDESGVV